MISVLEQMVDNREYKQALKYAESLLGLSWSQDEELRLNLAVMTARFRTLEYQGAIVSGEISAGLALSREAWDAYATACLWVGTSYYCLKQLGPAMDWWMKYLEYLPKYQAAAADEALIWFNLGTGQRTLENFEEAAQAYEKGLEAANRVGNERFAHGIRHALIEICTKLGKFHVVPELLAKCAHYLRHNPNALMSRESRLYHKVLRAEFALAGHRYNRVQALALRGLIEGEESPVHLFSFHMLLANVHAKKGELAEAFAHANAARMRAIQCRRYDYESQAARILYELSQSGEDILDKSNAVFLTAE